MRGAHRKERGREDSRKVRESSGFGLTRQAERPPEVVTLMPMSAQHPAHAWLLVAAQ